MHAGTCGQAQFRTLATEKRFAQGRIENSPEAVHKYRSHKRSVVLSARERTESQNCECEYILTADAQLEPLSDGTRKHCTRDGHLHSG
jgi:hypothetical protein